MDALAAHLAAVADRQDHLVRPELPVAWAAGLGQEPSVAALRRGRGLRDHANAHHPLAGWPTIRSGLRSAVQLEDVHTIFEAKDAVGGEALGHTHDRGHSG